MDYFSEAARIIEKHDTIADLILCLSLILQEYFLGPQVGELKGEYREEE